MIHRAISRLNWVYNQITDMLAFLSGVIVVCLMLAVSLEVILRYFFGRPTIWVTEMSGYALLYIPFLAAAWVQKREENVNVDLVINRMGEKARSFLNTITSLISAVVCVIITYYALKTTIYFFNAGYKTPTVLMLPKSLIIAVVFVGTFFLSIQFLIRTHTHYKVWKKLKNAAE